MISLNFKPAQRIVDHFLVTPDLTPWGRSYVKTQHGQTPERERANFHSIRQVLQPRTDEAQRLEGATGLYMLAFDHPFPSLYVGIAAEANNPEGILRRLRKHCIKAMGSNVGSATSTGGVHHPRQWCAFAIERHTFFDGAQDHLTDVRFTDAQASGGNHKAVLQDFERLICRNADGVLDGICDRIWPGCAAQDVCLLTSGTVHLRPGFNYRIYLW